jgi:hypothetical protein
MTWETVFAAANMLALIAWVALVLLPRKPFVLAAILYAGVGILCGTYAFSLIGLMTGTLNPGGPPVAMDFGSIEAIRAIFASDGGIVVGWVHYLAFDLFVGLWIARDADAKGISRFVQAPILFATLMAGPLGLFVWLVLREPDARRTGRWT